MRISIALAVSFCLLLAGSNAGFWGSTCAAAELAKPAPAPKDEKAAKPQPDASKPGDDPVVATIDNTEVIKKSEFDQIAATLMQRQMLQAQARGIHTEPQEFSHEQKLGILDDMVSSRILKILAKKAGVTVAEKDVDAEIENMKSKLPAGVNLDNYLKQQNMSSERLREGVRTRLSVERFERDNIKDAEIPDAEVTQEYEKMKSHGLLDTADFQHILVRVEGTDDAAWAQGKKDIDAAYARIKKGEDFGAVAKEVSKDNDSKDKGGQYTAIRRGRMRPEVDKRIFSMTVGEISEPFKSQFGWHIIKITKRDVTPEDQVKDGLKKVLVQVKRQQAVRKLVEDARSKMNVQLSLPAELADGKPALPLPQTPPANPPASVINQAI